MKRLSICSVLIIILSCQNQNNKNDVKEEIKNVSKIHNTDSLSAADKKLQEIEKEKTKKQISELKKNFIFDKDEFSKTGWYTHKNQTTNNSWNRKYLQLNVADDGYAYFESHYHSSDWIFHKKIKVKIGDDVYETDEVSGKDNRTNNSSGSIWEEVRYIGMRDRDIPKLIAESGTKPIKVRFEGDEKYDEIKLSEKDRKAIKDAWELSMLLKKINN